MAPVRYEHNPILTPRDIVPSRPDFEVIGAINAGVARQGDDIVLLVRVVERPVQDDERWCLVPCFDPKEGGIRVERLPRQAPGYDCSDPRLVRTPRETYLTGISYLMVARSSDGRRFELEPHHALRPHTEYETFGIEDPHVTLLDSRYYVTYVAVSTKGIVTALASTRDFQTWQRHGIIFAPDNKDTAIFPARIGGTYRSLHRPCAGFGMAEIWIAESPDLVCWGNHQHVAGVRQGMWDSQKVGVATVPVPYEQHWLVLYHGADDNDRYCLGALLLAGDHPARVVARSSVPVLEPQTEYETKGFYGNVVFSCGAVEKDGALGVYYGAADSSIAYAELPLSDITASFEATG
jgi:beta-1,2-mannobiose phosphorylase / 1,2-beta-oligomannan phosphorylase